MKLHAFKIRAWHVSAFLGALLVALTIRSFYRIDTVAALVLASRLQTIESNRGSFAITLSNLSAGDDWRWMIRHVSDVIELDSPPSGNWCFYTPKRKPFWGFRYEFNRLDPADFFGASWAVNVLFPTWVPAGLLLAGSIVPAFRSVRNLRRNSKGLCIVCGYDLRGTPDRCPECGTPASVALEK